MWIWPICNTVRSKICCIVIVLMSSSDFLNEHENLGQNHPCAVPSKIMSCHSYPASLLDQHSINNYWITMLTDAIWPSLSPCTVINPTLLTMLTRSSSTKYILNEHEASCQYGPCARRCQVAPILKIWRIYLINWIMITSSSDTLCP